jgi:BirA family biotin operon repressor/biotin-[acetyl-CoA-carboxylase] ligase
MTLKRKLLFFDTIDSTHAFAKKELSSFDPDVITCIRARTQTSGVGQNERKWVSIKGNLFVTYVLKVPGKVYPDAANFLSFCIYKTLETNKKEVYFKEPNDLYYNKKKCAGVLCHQAGDWLILSYGLNTIEAPELFSALDVDTEKMFKEIDSFLFLEIKTFLAEGLTPFQKEWGQLRRTLKTS